MFRNFSPDCCLWSFERVRLGPQCPAVIGLLAVVLSVSPVVVNAQTSSSIAGVVAGRVMNEQVWNSEYQTKKVGGVQVGAFLNARTSVPWFEMRAEFMWTQRGGSVVGDLRGGELIGEARTDYMTVAVQPRFAARLGLVEVFATAGPVIDVVLRNRFSPELDSLPLFHLRFTQRSRHVSLKVWEMHTVVTSCQLRTAHQVLS